MGSSKSFDSAGTLMKYEWQKIIVANGVKVLYKKDGRQSTPILSRSPNSIYARISTKTGKIDQISVYNANRNKIKDIDWGHDHTNEDGTRFNKGEIHVQEYQGVERRSNSARKPTKSEQKLARKMMAVGKTK